MKAIDFINVLSHFLDEISENPDSSTEIIINGSTCFKFSLGQENGKPSILIESTPKESSKKPSRISTEYMSE